MKKMAGYSMEGINFDIMPSKYWDDSTKISYLQRRILVYSIMYYELNQSVVSDKTYDELSKQLVHMQQSVDKSEFEKSMYYYVMYDFDGTTGFDLYSRLNQHDKEYLMKIAKSVIEKWRRESW